MGCGALISELLVSMNAFLYLCVFDWCLWFVCVGECVGFDF